MFKRLGWFVVGVVFITIGISGFWWAILGDLANNQALFLGSVSTLLWMIGISAIYWALKI
ncbi:hypothetical protein [Secundilactobacillus kimchicus]|uniref:hypothetical protein n=1 Tax=Secundilactobacillus kimchicus TaxID=528209 RepID=UPI0024A8276C|nr:hypothetical protein [Secundilactobacillus kimchicus]